MANWRNANIDIGPFKFGPKGELVTAWMAASGWLWPDPAGNYFLTTLVQFALKYTKSMFLKGKCEGSVTYLFLILLRKFNGANIDIGPFEVVP